jgi:hypothetical protein
MAGIVEERSLGPRQKRGKLIEGGKHALVIELGRQMHRESQALKRRGDGLGIVHRVLERCGPAVAGVTDHERHPLLGREA